MSSKTLRIVRLVIVCGVLGSMGPAVSAAWAQTTANGAYYAQPSWDQKLPADTRFIVLANWNNEAVLDRDTGLVWERSPRTTMFDWAHGQSNCGLTVHGNRMGWRLPSAPELMSLLDLDTAGQSFALPPGHPFLNVQAGANFGYWTSSPETAVQNAVVVVNFGNVPGLENVGPSHVFGEFVTFQSPIWCVRSPATPDHP
jgi:Protein of unknown function (DUF1566)